ncbi:MAG: protein kinase [Verrucomicrobiales bacterium]|nr:protein kinase [Verrucomicrobiales bacterium]
MPNPTPSRRAREIFERALDFNTPQERDAFLEEACGSDDALRHRVRALVSAESAGRDLLPDTPSSANLARVAIEQVGDVIGPYRLARVIGEGGCGVVYLADQAKPVRRQVALKVIKAGMDTKSVIARFEAERQALALMDHPHIAKVLDAGATQTGRPFFVMEWVDGTRITDFAARHSLDIDARLRLFIQVCQAVQHAHQKGVIHRDIKPSNILVALHDGYPAPKVIDFGIAKATETPLTEKTLLTQDHSLIGTPAYMSPEQAEGTGAHLDTRSDIYSLGVLLYELLTGETPFDTNSLLRSGLDHLRYTIRTTLPARPSARILARRPDEDARSPAADRIRWDWANRVRGDLDWIVMKCLEKDRNRRYETANGLAADLRRHLAHEPVVARPPSRLYLTRKFVQRHQGVVAATSIIALLLVSGIAVATGLAFRAHRAEARERQLRQEAERNELAARQARDDARLRAYTSDMRSAASAVEASHFGRAIDLLRRHFPGPDQLDLRGLEWRYLWQVAQGDESDTLPHAQFVKCTRFSPDRSWLATSSFDPDVRIYDLTHRQVVTNFLAPGEHDSYHNLSVSPDGRWLAIGTSAGVVVRETQRWSVQFTNDTQCNAVLFSPDSSRLACLATHRVDVFSTEDWRRSGSLTNEGQGVGCLAFAPDNRHLAVVRRENPHVEIWDISGPHRVARVEAYGLLASVAVSPDARWLAAGNSEGDLRLWNWANYQLVVTQRVHAGWVFSAVFAPDGRHLITGGADQALHVWDCSQPSVTGLVHQITLRGHRNEIWTTDISADGRHLVSGGKDTTAKLWDLPQSRETVQMLQAAPGTMSLGFMTNSAEFVVFTPEDPHLEIWNVSRNIVTHRIPVQPHGAVILNPPTAFFGNTSGIVQAWTLPSVQPRYRSAVSDGPVMALQVTADASHGVVWNPRQSLATLWKLDPLERLTDFPDLATAEAGPSWYKAQRLAFSPDGRWIAYAAERYSIRLWNIPLRRYGPTLHGHLWHIQSLRFSPDGTRLASGSWDAQVRLWDTQSGSELVPPLLGHLTGIGSLSFSADGRTLASRGGDDSLRFWSTANGSELLSLNGATVWFFDMLSKDGRAMAWEQGGFSGRVRIQYLPTLAEIDSLTLDPTP